MVADEDDIAVFLEEATDLQADFEQCLLLLETLPDDQEVLNKAFRCAHTIKGGAGMVGFEALQGFTHQLESLLDRLRDRQQLCTRPVTDALLAAADVISLHLSGLREGKRYPVVDDAKARAMLGALLGEPAAAAPAPAAPIPPEMPSSDDEPQLTPVRAAPVVVSEVAPAPLPPPPPARAPEFSVPHELDAAHEEHPVARASAPEAAPSAPDSRKKKDEATTIRVPLEKVDRLVNLVGELAIAQSMVSQLTPRDAPALKEAIAHLDRYCRELQERVLGIRMIPVKSVFDRFHRVVRDLSGHTGKRVSLAISGEETELDKTVIEKISDPLTHLVRNAIDHGLELPEERVAKGKAAEGSLQLIASQRGANVFIEVADDGRGLDHEKILAKARRQGLITGNATPTEDEINALIFHPGFSTADQVTELSGRGVGMDVVRRNVDEFKGKISIFSTPGKGTRFRIQLPLTLAMVDGLALRVGREVYLMPLLSVSGSFRPTRKQLNTVGESAEVVQVRENYIPLVRLHDVLGRPTKALDPTRGIVVVVDDGDRTFAVLADELMGQQQVVVKSLETNFRRLPGVSGATVLGDGRVALILDVGSLFELGQRRGGRRSFLAPAELAPQELS